MPQKRYAVSRPEGHAGPKTQHLQFRGAHVLEEGGDPDFINFDPEEDAAQMQELRDRGYLIVEAGEVETPAPGDALSRFLLDARKRHRPTAPPPPPPPAPAPEATDDGGKVKKGTPTATPATVTTKEEGK